MSGLDEIRAGLDKKFRHAVIMPASAVGGVEFYPTGLTCFDAQVGGLPQGRLVLISGLPGTGKSTFCYRCMGLVGQSLLIDSEGSYTPEWGALFGLSDENLIVVRPEHMDEAYNVVDYALANYQLNYVVIDSAAGMSAEPEMERESGASGSFGERAVRNNALCRRVIARTRRHQHTTVILVQHLYENVEAGGYSGGSKYVLSGGSTQQYLNSLHLQFSRARVITEEIAGAGDEREKRTIGFVLRWKVDHAKVCYDGLNGLWRLFTRNSPDPEMPRIGHIDDAPELLRLSVLSGVIQRRSSWYVARAGQGDAEVRMQGEVAAQQWAYENREELLAELRAALHD